MRVKLQALAAFLTLIAAFVFMPGVAFAVPTDTARMVREDVVIKVGSDMRQHCRVERTIAVSGEVATDVRLVFRGFLGWNTTTIEKVSIRVGDAEPVAARQVPFDSAFKSSRTGIGEPGTFTINDAYDTNAEIFVFFAATDTQVQIVVESVTEPVGKQYSDLVAVAGPKASYDWRDRERPEVGSLRIELPVPAGVPDAVDQVQVVNFGPPATVKPPATVVVDYPTDAAFLEGGLRIAWPRSWADANVQFANEWSKSDSPMGRGERTAAGADDSLARPYLPNPDEDRSLFAFVAPLVVMIYCQSAVFYVIKKENADQLRKQEEARAAMLSASAGE